MGNRRISVPKLVGAARKEAAVNVAALAKAGLSDPQIGKRLKLTADQVRRVREQFKIGPGQPIEPGRPKHGGVTTGDCPFCGAAGLRLWGGLVGAHDVRRVRLVPSVDGPRPQEYETGVRCEGSRQAPAGIDDGGLVPPQPESETK